MKLKVSKGKYVLDEDDLKSLFLYVFQKGVENGIRIEAGLDGDLSQQQLGLFILEQPSLKTKRENKKNLPKTDFSIPLEERKKTFVTELSKFLGEYTKDQLNEFYSVWAEHNVGENKMRFERPDVFNIEMRLKRFNFRNKNNSNEPKKTRLDKFRERIENRNGFTGNG